MDLTIARSAPAAHSREGGAPRQINLKFLLECLAKCFAVEFVKQRLKRRAKHNLVDGETAGCRNLRIIGVDLGLRLGGDKLRYDQVFKRLAHQRSRTELPDAEIM